MDIQAIDSFHEKLLQRIQRRGYRVSIEGWWSWPSVSPVTASKYARVMTGQLYTMVTVRELNFAYVGRFAVSPPREEPFVAFSNDRVARIVRLQGRGHPYKRGGG